MHHPLTPDMRKGIEACQRCHNICLQTAMGHGLETGGSQVEAAHLRLMIDCAEICVACADFLLRGSHFHDQACQLCATICEACGLACEQAGGMSDCVHACQRCAENCRHIVETMVVST